MKFTQPVSMKVDEKQFNYLAVELEKRGYELDFYTGEGCSFKYIATNLGNENDKFSDFNEDAIKERNRHYIDHYNPELFLALASMTDEKNGIAGEYVVFTDSSYSCFTKGKLYKLIATMSEVYFTIDDEGDRNGFCDSAGLKMFRKATKQELINHLTKESSMISNNRINSNISSNTIYQVKQSDLVGDIYNFPIEIVQKMVERQVGQGNKADISAFQRCLAAGKYSGFIWNNSIEGDSFWREVILYKDFNLFFQKYPKDNQQPTTESTHKVTRSQMAEIHKIACEGWKKKIMDMVSSYFSPLDEEVELPNSEVKAMFNAATSTQKPVLERMFPNYGKKVIAKDTLVMCSDTGICWNLRYYSHDDRCFSNGQKSMETNSTANWKHIVPAPEFDFNDLASNVRKSIV